MSRRRRKKKKGLSLSGLTVLLVLCMIMILFDLYLFMRSSLSSSSTVVETETQTQSDTAPAVTSLPQVIQVEQPDVQLTEETDTEEAADDAEQTESAVSSDGFWQNSTLAFQYDTASMWVSESGGVISVTDQAGSTLPRADIQVLSDAEDLTETEFSSLAGAAVRAYFSFEPAEDAVVVTACSVAGGVYEAELTVDATDVSPAMLAWVRLEDGILTSMLLEADADADTIALWQTLLQSVEPL